MEGLQISDNPLLIATGALNVDYIYNVEEVTLDGESCIKDIEIFTGGSASNTAKYLQKWHIPSMVTGILGDDDDGRFFMDELKKMGLSLYIRIKNGPTGRANIFVDKKGRRSIYVMPGVNLFLKKEDLPQGEILRRIKWVHATSLIGEDAMESQLSYLCELPRDIRLSLSPGMIYSRYGYRRFSDILKRTEVAFFNKDEIQLFTQKNDTLSAIMKLHEMGVKIVSVTLGREGSILSSIKEDEPHRLPSFAEEVVDTVGAGDAFSAGIIYGIIKDLPLNDTHIIAAISAAYAVRSRGAGSTIPEIEEILKKKDLIKTQDVKNGYIRKSLT